MKPDIERALGLFPNAILMGSDYDYNEVQRAVDEVAKKHKLDVYAEGGKYWVFTTVTVLT